MNGSRQTEALAASARDDIRDAAQIIINFYKMFQPHLLEHSRELARWSVALARHMGWSEDVRRVVMYGAMFHDVGHLASLCLAGAPKPKGLKQMNMETEHPGLGVQLLTGVKCLEPILPIVRHHHEHYDGTGFPDGLKGEAIAAPARLVALVHTYQTLIHGFSTTPPMSPAEARKVIREDAGFIHDPKMVPPFLELLRTMEAS